MKHAVLLTTLGCIGICNLSHAAEFDAFDPVAFAQYTALPCIHPTANSDKAQAEIAKPTVVEGDVSKTRVRVFYDGWIKKNSSLLEIYQKSGIPVLVKLDVLEDLAYTGVYTRCKYLNNGWQEVE